MNEDLYRAIKERIVFLDYKPGQPLTLSSLAKEFGVSVTPIREALIRLEAEGLVHSSRNRSAYVSEISLTEIRDAFEVRLMLIGEVGRLAAQRITEAELRALLSLLDEMRNAKERKQIIRIDSQLHDAVNRATKNSTLVKVLGNLRSQVTRLWFFVSQDESYSLNMIQDFACLCEALQRRDEEKCQEILRKHVISFVEEVKGFLYNAKPKKIGGGDSLTITTIRL